MHAFSFFLSPFFPASEEVVTASNHLALQKHKFTCHERNWFDPVANNPEKYRASPQQSRLFFSRGFAKGTRAQIFFLSPFLSLSLFFSSNSFKRVSNISIDETFEREIR